MLIDFHLTQRAQEGDKGAFTEIVSAYRNRILGMAARLINSPENAEEVSHEAFLRLYLSLSNLRSAEVFESWLYLLTVHAASGYLRKQRRRTAFRVSGLSAQQLPRAKTAEGGNIGREQPRGTLIRIVDKFLGAVSKEDRILLILKEVEEVYRTNANALNARVFRARRRVLKAFGSFSQSWF